MDNNNFLHLGTLDYIEFWVSNSKSFIKSFLQPLNYHPIGVHRTSSRIQYLVVNSPDLEKIKIINGLFLNAPAFIVTVSFSSNDHEFHSMRQSHGGDFIKTVAFNTTNVNAAYENAVRHGAVSVAAPSTPFPAVSLASVKSPFHDVDHVLIQRHPSNLATTSKVDQILNLYPDFLKLDGSQFKYYSKPSIPLTIHLDHIATCVQNGKLDSCIQWYMDCFNFDLLKEETSEYNKSTQGGEETLVAQQLIDEHSRSQHRLVESTNLFNIRIEEDIGLKMVVLSSGPASINGNQTPPLMLVISEASITDKGQVEKFIDFNGGSGLQHIAFYTDNIFEAVEYARDHLLEFIDIPDAYYNNLGKRKELETILSVLPEESIKNLYKYKVLIDSDYERNSPKENYILQIFSKTICDTPTFFFELISRAGAKGFGKGNIKALFESVEREIKKENSMIRA